jgi:hypothetical protein
MTENHMTRVRYLTGLLAPTLLLFGLAVLAAPSANAQRAPDGDTPAVDNICTQWGFTGNIIGLCRAYCEAMDCDAAEPKASEQACTRVLGKIEEALGEAPFPTCEDVDDDGVPDGIDNCPDDANPDQEDSLGNGLGDVCDPELCFCFGVDGAPATVADAIDDALDWAAGLTQAPNTENCVDSVLSSYNQGYRQDNVVEWGWGMSAGLALGRLHCSMFRVDELGVGYGSFELLTPTEADHCRIAVRVLQAEDPLDICP